MHPPPAWGEIVENFSSAVQYAPVVCNPVQSCLLMQIALLSDFNLFHFFSLQTNKNLLN